MSKSNFDILHFVKTRKLEVCLCLDWFSIALWLDEYVATALSKANVKPQKWLIKGSFCPNANFVDICCELIMLSVCSIQFAWWHYCWCTCTCCQPPLIGQRSDGVSCHWPNSGVGHQRTKLQAMPQNKCTPAKLQSAINKPVCQQPRCEKMIDMPVCN